MGLAGVILGLLALEHGLRPDLANQFGNVHFSTRLAASLATGMLAAITSRIASQPDRSRLWLLLPPLAIKLSGIVYGCLTGWVAFDAGRMAPGETLRCFATLLPVSLPLSAAMPRHTARLQPVIVTLTAGLAVGAIARRRCRCCPG